MRKQAILRNKYCYKIKKTKADKYKTEICRKNRIKPEYLQVTEKEEESKTYSKRKNQNIPKVKKIKLKGYRVNITKKVRRVKYKKINMPVNLFQKNGELANE